MKKSLRFFVIPNEARYLDKCELCVSFVSLRFLPSVEMTKWKIYDFPF